MTTAATCPPTAAARTTAPVAAAPAVAVQALTARRVRVSVSDTVSRDSRHPVLAIPTVQRTVLICSASGHQDPRVAGRRHARQRGCAGARR